MKLMAPLFVFLIFVSSVEGRDISFRHEFSSNASLEILWQDFERALTDSKRSLLWPDQSRVIGDGLLHDGRIEVTYRMGLTSPSYQYQILIDEFSETKRSFRYVALGDHPFRGGASITLESMPNGSVRLVWDGFYDTRGSGFLARLAFKNFETRFFRAFSSNLQDFED